MSPRPRESAPTGVSTREKNSILTRAFVISLAAAACGDSEGGSSTTSPTEVTTSGTVETDGTSTTQPNQTTGAMTEGTDGSGSMSGTGSTTEQATTGMTTAIDPTGAECSDKLECPQFGDCIENKCECNTNHTGDDCNTCVDGTVMTVELGCVDNPCEPNPCENSADCTVNEENGEPQCPTSAPVITNLMVDCNQGANNDECLAGGNAYQGSFDVMYANNCNLKTDLVSGSGSVGLVDGMVQPINDKATFNFVTGNTKGDVTEITVTCTGNGGPSAPVKTEVTHE